MFSNIVIIAKRQNSFKCLFMHLFLYIRVFFSVCLSMHFMLSDDKEQKRMLDPPKRGVTDSPKVLGIEPRSSVRAKSAFNYCNISLALRIKLLFDKQLPSLMGSFVRRDPCSKTNGHCLRWANSSLSVYINSPVTGI